MMPTMPYIDVTSFEYLNYFSTLDGSYYRTDNVVLITVSRHEMANSVQKRC